MTETKAGLVRTQAEMARANAELRAGLYASLKRERVLNGELRSRAVAQERGRVQEEELRFRIESLKRELERERDRSRQLRYRLADRCNRLLQAVPLMHRLLKSFVLFLLKTSNALSPTWARPAG